MATAAAACSGGAGSGAPASDSASPAITSPPAEAAPVSDSEGTVTIVHEPDVVEPATVWEEFLSEMDEDGRVPKNVALEAFALAYGPIPGVEVRSGEPGMVASMTARSWLSQHLDDLPPTQTEAIRAALQTLDADGRPMDEWSGTNEDDADQEDGADQEGGADEEGALGANGVANIAFAQQSPPLVPTSCWNFQPIALANAPGSDLYRPLIDAELTLLEAKLGPLGIPVYLGFGAAEGGVLADADPWNADCDQRASSCTVRLMPQAVADFTGDRENLRSVLVHELMHCYQGARAPVNNVRDSLPWIVEGFATFAQRDVHPEIESIVNGWWALWFDKPMHALNGRAYDAIGFFEHLVAVGGDPWESFEAALASTQSTQQFSAFTDDVRVEFVETWASSVSRQPDRGSAWDDGLPGMPDSVPTLATVGIGDETQTRFTTLPFGAALVDLEFNAAVVIVDPTVGHGRLGWGSGEEIVLDPAGASAVYCADPGGCVCPGGSPTGLMTDLAPTMVDIPFDFALLAVSSDPMPGEVIITGMSMVEVCADGTESSDDQHDDEGPLWVGNVCALLSDADVAAIFGGRGPESVEPADTNTLAAEGYGGASCRWKISGGAGGEYLTLDVFPATDQDLEYVASYNPWDTWSSERLAGVGDEAWVQRWIGDPALQPPGTVVSVVVRQGGVGLRLDISAEGPPEPDGLVAAARLILERD